MLPTRLQMSLLFEFHADFLVFLHASFHAQTFRRELDQFYTNDHGIISMSSTNLQWTALLLAIICCSMTCVKQAQLLGWGFRQEDQVVLAKQWYQASVECLNTSKYQQNHCIYSVQAISCSTTCAHPLGFSNSQSVYLASAVRIAQSLGLHRLGRPKRGDSEPESEPLTDVIQRETGRRVWQQLTIQDWFSVPFSETYCINPLHFSTIPPLHCDETTMLPSSSSEPSVVSYGNFLSKISFLMPALQDQYLEAHTLEAKYDIVLRFDKTMRDIVVLQLPTYLNGQTPLDPSWPPWVSLARRCLTITSAHKIIMIHRRFLGISFHNKRFAFTRRTCLAAAKTIINEIKLMIPEGSPTIWATQAFGIAAAIILSLDNFNSDQSAIEYGENRQLVAETIESLSSTISISSIAARGTRLLTELLAEEHGHAQNLDANHPAQRGHPKASDGLTSPNATDKSLNVAAFVRKFCESDQPQPSNPSAAMSHMPLWLQQESSYEAYTDSQRRSDNMYSTSQHNGSFLGYQYRAPQPLSSYDMLDLGYQAPPIRRQNESVGNPFMQNLPDDFDISGLNWFDDLSELAPPNSI